MSTLLDRKTALVTGAGRGLGRAIAMGLASAGGTVGAMGKAALEAHTLNLAVELAYSGVTATCSGPGRSIPRCGRGSAVRTRPGSGRPCHERFSRSYEAGILITPEHSARSLLARLDSDATGQTRDVSDPP